MKSTLTVVTLGVRELKRSLEFYRDRLGWPASQPPGADVAFFQAGGVILALYPREALAEDATVDPTGHGFSGITLAHNVRSEREVDDVLEEAKRAGARIVKTAQQASWGEYSGYFADPDGYLWEVVYNPHWKLDQQGRVVL